ncbi:hypothetical protein AgCh_024682 [Apium graveolens]
MVATKVVRGVEKYREAAMIEVDVLQQLGKNEKKGNCLFHSFFGLDDSGDMSSGFFGFVENHMEEVIMFFETHHKKWRKWMLISFGSFNDMQGSFEDGKDLYVKMAASELSE